MKADFDLKDSFLQEEEVDDVKVVSPKDLITIIFEADYRDDEYKEIVKGFIGVN